MYRKFRIHNFLSFLIFIVYTNSPFYSQSNEDIHLLQSAIDQYKRGEYNKAEYQLRQLLVKGAKFNDPFQIQLHNNLGNIYADIGKNSKAVHEYTTALSIASQLSNPVETAKIQKNLGTVFMSLGRFNRAEYYYKRALTTAQTENQLILEADCLNNLGTIYEQTNRLDEAKQAYFNALNIYSLKNKLAEIPMVSSNLALVYKALKKMDSCLYYNEQALQATKDLNDPWMEAAIANNIGNVYGEMGQLENALFYLNHSLKISQQIKALEVEIMTLESLADAYAKAGNYEKAFDFLKKMQKTQEKFNSLSINKEIEALNIRYQSKEKDLITKELKVKQQRTLWISLVVVISLIFIAVLVILILRKRQKEEHLRDLTYATLESETRTRFNLASDLHDHIGQKIALITMFTHQLSTPSAQQKMQTYLADLGQEIRKLSHQLVPEAFKFGLTRSLEELKKEIETISSIQVHLNIQSDSFSFLNARENLNLYRIIQELTSNSIKHGKSSQINIIAEKTQFQLTITISDNGIGFNKKAFLSSSGIGWKTIEARLQAMNSSFQITSSKIGSSIELVIPIQNNE